MAYPYEYNRTYPSARFKSFGDRRLPRFYIFTSVIHSEAMCNRARKYL